MKFTYTFSVELPQRFVEWLKRNKFVQQGDELKWKKTEGLQSSADYEIIRIIPDVKNNGRLGYSIIRDYWGKAWSKKRYAYDGSKFNTFAAFLRNPNA